MTKKITQEENDLLIKVDELTSDLQRVRADFENYRKRVDDEKQAARDQGEMKAVMKLLPIIDIIEMATADIPAGLADNDWAKGIVAMRKSLDKAMNEIELAPINAAPGTDFNHDFHNAIQFDEDSEGEREVIAEVLQPGYTYRGIVLRPAMVRVTRK